MYLAIDLLRRRGVNGFTYLGAPSAPPPAEFTNEPPFASLNGTYALSNFRRDRYDSVQIKIHQNLGKQYEWFASYTRSRAVSNAVLDVSVDQVLAAMNDFGPMPWDTPNRFLGRTYLPLPRKNWAIAILADARSGFPFSIQDEAGRVIGSVNSRRYPFNFDLNVHIERMFTIRSYRFALRAGVNNLTNSRNPTAVNTVLGSPNYLQSFGDEGRHFQVRLRFFGRK